MAATKEMENIEGSENGPENDPGQNLTGIVYVMCTESGFYLGFRLGGKLISRS